MSMIDELAPEILLTPAETVAAVREWEQRTAVLALAVRRLETSGEWATDGVLSMKAWLRHQARMSDQRANELLATGRFLDACPAFAQAALSATLSGSQIAVARRLHRPKYTALLADAQAELVELLAPLDIDDTLRAVEHWKVCADAVLDDGTPPLEAPSELTFARTLDNELHGSFHLADGAATEFEKAIANAITWDGETETRTLPERQGDALFDIAAFFNKHHHSAGTPKHLPTISISADITTVTTDHPEGVNDDTGRPVSPACTATYLCDCKIHTILRTADGAPAAFGRATYTVPRKLMRQLVARDGGCRVKYCTRKACFTDAHHIHYWEHGGPTDYDNLLLLCRRHHLLIHQQHVEITLEPNGDATFTWPNGTTHTTHPRGAPPTRKPPRT